MGRRRKDGKTNNAASAAQHAEAAGQESDSETGYKVIQEGLATIQVPVAPNASSSNGNEERSVFYNPIQQFNRDLSVLVINEFAEWTLAFKRDKVEQARAKKAAKGRNKRSREPDKEGVSAAKRVKIEDAATEVYQEPVLNIRFTIMDALSATGIRAIRYAREIKSVTSVTANDMSATAVEAVRANVERSGVERMVHVENKNALQSLYSTAYGEGRAKYDVIELDPYGSAAPFFDAAVQALSDGGLLCATSTDSAIFASVGYPEKTFALYGGVPVRGPYSHEAGLRIVLHAIASSAARYGIAIEPLLSLSIDYYVRVFVRVWRSPAQVKFLGGKTMLVYSCDHGCGAWTTQPMMKTKENQTARRPQAYKHGLAQAPAASKTCAHCGFKTHLGGPMWAGPIHSSSFIQRILDRLPQMSSETYATKQRIQGVLTTALEEDLDYVPRDAAAFKEEQSEVKKETSPDAMQSSDSSADPARIDPYPFYFIPSALAGVIHCSTPPENAFRGALKHLGFRVTRSHAKAGSFKTDAPWSVVWEVMRQWVKQKAPVKEGSVKEGTAGKRILSQPPLTRGEVYGVEQVNEEDNIKREESEMLEIKREDTESIKREDASTSPEIKLEEEGDEGFKQEDASPGQATTLGENAPLKVVFDERLGAIGAGRELRRTTGLVRYQANPRPNWGPMTRARA